MTHARRSGAAPTGYAPPARGGFTLVELLVVVIIIAVLVGLLSGATMRIRDVMKRNTTEDTVSKCQTGIDAQIHGINQMVRAEQNDRSADYSQLLVYCDNDADRARALLTYCRLRQYFPLTAADLTAPAFTVGGVSFRRPVGMQQLNGLAGDPHHVAAAILHAALSKRALGNLDFEVDTGLNGAQTDLGGPTLNRTRRVFQDAWGNPVGYALISEAQLPELGTAPHANPNAVSRDPFDPHGKLATWSNAANKQDAQNRLGVAFDGRNKWLIAYSAGLNRVYDSNFGGDDILGHRTKSVGTRGTKQ